MLRLLAHFSCCRCQANAGTTASTHAKELRVRVRFLTASSMATCVNNTA